MWNNYKFLENRQCQRNLFTIIPEVPGLVSQISYTISDCWVWLYCYSELTPCHITEDCSPCNCIINTKSAEPVRQHIARGLKRPTQMIGHHTEYRTRSVINMPRLYNVAGYRLHLVNYCLGNYPIRRNFWQYCSICTMLAHATWARCVYSRCKVWLMITLSRRFYQNSADRTATSIASGKCQITYKFVASLWI
jgi:hypothetical protein